MSSSGEGHSRLDGLADVQAAWSVAMAGGRVSHGRVIVEGFIDFDCEITLLVGFELYSTECAARNQNDAALHRHLHEVTSAARTTFEQALARVVVEEGLVLQT